MTDDRKLDAALRRLMASPTEGQVDPATGRVVARLEAAQLPPQKRALAWWPSMLMDWNFAPAWPRVAMLAGAAALGISIGLSGFGTRIATDLELVRVASADEASVFEVDPVAGLRP
jgi:hypothetical protein